MYIYIYTLLIYAFCHLSRHGLPSIICPLHSPNYRCSVDQFFLRLFRPRIVSTLAIYPTLFLSSPFIPSLLTFSQICSPPFVYLTCCTSSIRPSPFFHSLFFPSWYLCHFVHSPFIPTMYPFTICSSLFVHPPFSPRRFLSPPKS